MALGNKTDATGGAEERFSQQKALILLYGMGNPLWALEVAGQVTFPSDVVVYGCRDRFLSLVPKMDNTPQTFCLPDHVFTVAVPIDEEDSIGLMVPVIAEASVQWHLSGGLGRLGGDAQQPVRMTLSRILETLERCWKEVFQKVLPLRWKQPYTFELTVPVPLGAVDGACLQWPLAVALLRAAATGAGEGAIPFGHGPVFATGTLGDSGQIGGVDDIRAKLSGFFREYGHKRPILLTTPQRELVADLLSEGMDVNVIDHVNDLFRHSAFELGRAMFGKAPGTGILDSLMVQMAKDDAGVRFQRTVDMVEWLLPATAQRPWYRFQLLFQRGAVRLHHGDPGDAEDHWKSLDRNLRDGPQFFGADDRIKLSNAWSEFWLDHGQPERGLEILQSKEVATVLPYGSLKERAYYWGQCSQLCRAAGRFDDAVRAGENALELARQGCGSLAGRFANYTIHALLTRTRHIPAHGSNDLDQAYRLLCESREQLLPNEDTFACEIHRGFCSYYEAEYHRLKGSPYVPEPFSRAPQAWDHPRLFVLLSAVRNTHNPYERRLAYADDLVDLSGRMCRAVEDTPLFQILDKIYALLCFALKEESGTVAFEALETLLDSDEKDFKGWVKRLASAMDTYRQVEKKGPKAVWSAALGLCDAIPYH